jgi:hypothetical protein
MKNFTLLYLCLSLCFTFLNAQDEFAPIGAKWYVNASIEEIWETDPLQDFYTLESKSDTIINDTIHRVVGDHLFYQDGGQVYYRWQHSLRLIYDYDVAVGDTVTFEMASCTLEPDSIELVTFRVDAVSTVEVQGVPLKRVQCQWIEGAYGYEEDYIYLERIGSVRVMIENFTNCVLVTGAVEEWLRCYQDEDIDFKTQRFLNLDGEDCSYRNLTSLDNEPNSSSITAYPNPFRETIKVEWPGTRSFVLSLYNSQGKLVQQLRGEGAAIINSQHLPDGLYWLSVQKEHQDLPTWHKMVKQ